MTAGPEVDAESARRWQDGRPDEAYFLDRFAAAVVEQLVLRAMTWLCREASAREETAIAHLSPGCGGWEFEAQRPLFELLADGAVAGERVDGEELAPARLAPFAMLASGMLRPKSSLLAAIGLSRDPRAVGPADLCRGCDLSPCRFRRAAYSGEVR
jgi:hypothetical protein